MNAFVTDYIQCMLWLTSDENGDPISDIASSDIAPTARETILAECTDFYNANRETWERGGWDEGQAGHDFYLTRNGHGAGFWDRQFNDASEECGKILTENCRPYGEQNLYRGDDGKFYV